MISFNLRSIVVEPFYSIIKNMKKLLCSAFCLTIILCVVTNDIPGPPEILSIHCDKYQANLVWSPSGDASVTEYIIEYKNNWFEEWKVYENKFYLRGKNEVKTTVLLSPWTTYKFRVISKNKAGVSLHSYVSQSCQTAEDIPYKNPQLVYGRGNGPNNLVISWTPMPPLEQNADGFYYKVYWRQNDIPEAKWHWKVICNCDQHKLVIQNLPKLKPFRIKVEAYNRLGKSRIEAHEVIGYSDEDKPRESPKRFRVLEIRDGKSVKLNWETVSPISINGHFKGYKIQAWIENNEENKSEKIVPSDVTTDFVSIFTPGEVNYANILAFNGAFDGPPSDPIEITTPEDVYPDPPKFTWTRIIKQNNKAVIRISLEPNLVNGNPEKSFYIRYRKKGIDSENNWVNTASEPIEESNSKIDLFVHEFGIYYDVQVVAQSGKLETASNLVMIDTRAEKWSVISITTTTTTSTEKVIEYESVVNHPNVDPDPKPVHFDPNNRRAINESSFKIPGQDSSASLAKSPLFITLLCVLSFICGIFGVFIFFKRRIDDENKRNGRTHADSIRIELKNHNQELHSFIVPVETKQPNGHSDGHCKGGRHDDGDYDYCPPPRPILRF